MKAKGRQHKENKKQPGVFGLKKKQNKAKRSYVIAVLTGGKAWADELVSNGKIDSSLLH